MNNIIPGKAIPPIENTPFVDAFGDPILTADGRVYTRRTIDDLYWNGTIWVVARTAIAAVKIGDVKVPGGWRFILPLAAVDGEPDSVYVFEFEDFSGLAANAKQRLGIEIGGSENTINLLRKRAFNRLFHDPLDGKLKLYDDDMTTVIAESQALNNVGDVLQPIEFSLVTPVQRTGAVLL